MQIRRMVVQQLLLKEIKRPSSDPGGQWCNNRIKEKTRDPGVDGFVGDVVGRLVDIAKNEEF